MPRPKRKGKRPARSHGKTGRVTVTAYLPDDEFDALEEYVKEDKGTRSDTIRRAIREYIRRHPIDSEPDR